MPSFTHRKEMKISFVPYLNGTSVQCQDTLSVMPWERGPLRAAGGSAKRTPSPGEAVCICASWLPSDPAAPRPSMIPQAYPGPLLWFKVTAREPLLQCLKTTHPGASYRNLALGACRNITQLLTAGRRLQGWYGKSARWQTLRGKKAKCRTVYLE